MGRRKTHEEFIRDFYAKNKNAENIEILGEYINNSTKIKCKCKLDNFEWSATPKNLLNNHGCPKCAGNNKKTTENFINELKEVNENIEILGEYKGNKVKIKCKCKIDGHEWEMTPNCLLSGQSCPKCGIKSRVEKQVKTHEDFKQELKEVNENIEILGKYINNHTKIKCKCKKDGYEWETTPNNLLNNHGCPKCSGNIRNKTTEYFINELKEVNENIEILGEYKGNKIKTKVRCKIDGYEWEATPNNLLNGYGCPKCNESKGEKRVAKYLDNKSIDYIQQYKFDDCRSKDKLPFDFYIPSKNIVIEYDGKQHYEIIDYFGGFDSFVEGKIRDTIKTKYCEKNNIKLIRIPYWDFDNIEEILDRELEEFLK